MSRTWKGQQITGYRTEYREYEIAGGRDASEEIKFAILEDGTEVDTRDIADAEHLANLYPETNTRN